MNLKFHPEISFEVGSMAPTVGLLRIKTVPGGDIPLYGMPYEDIIGAVVSKLLVIGDEVAAFVATCRCADADIWLFVCRWS